MTGRLGGEKDEERSVVSLSVDNYPVILYSRSTEVIPYTLRKEKSSINACVSMQFNYWTCHDSIKLLYLYSPLSTTSKCFCVQSYHARNLTESLVANRSVNDIKYQNLSRVTQWCVGTTSRGSKYGRKSI